MERAKGTFDFTEITAVYLVVCFYTLVYACWVYMCFILNKSMLRGFLFIIYLFISVEYCFWFSPLFFLIDPRGHSISIHLDLLPPAPIFLVLLLESLSNINKSKENSTVSSSVFQHFHSHF